MPDTPQLDPPSNRPHHPHLRLPGLVVIAAIVSAVAMAPAVYYAPRALAAFLASLAYAVSVILAFQAGRHLGGAEQQQNDEEADRG